MKVTVASDSFLQRISDELAISETRYQQAQESYNALGRWLHREQSKVRGLDPSVYVQGSFRLGTAIKPSSSSEEYDVDAVCELKALSTSGLTQAKLKALVGEEIRDYHRAQNFSKPVHEGRRCWTLQYSEGAQFHLDILPAVPDSHRQRLLLEKAGYGVNWVDTSIAITDREHPHFTLNSNDWPRSNPRGYAKWFTERMGSLFESRRRALAEVRKAEVEDIPIYAVRTPLQSAVMILKKHRDENYSGDPADKPISIILTTLAARSYNGEEAIGSALLGISQRMKSHLERDEHGGVVVRNPTDPMENFADKWSEFPQRAKAFFDWLTLVERDFAELSNIDTLDKVAKRAAPTFGRQLVEKAAENPSGRDGLLRTAASAGAASFSDKPRTPSTPKGFA